MDITQKEIDDYIASNKEEFMRSLGNGVYKNVVYVPHDVVQNAMHMQRKLDLITYDGCEVLDSNFVRIKPGDYVWGNSDNKKWYVVCVDDGEYGVHAIDKKGRNRDLKPEWLTHDKPDTWNDVRSDAAKIADELPNTIDDERLIYTREKILDIVKRCYNLALNGKF